MPEPWQKFITQFIHSSTVYKYEIAKQILKKVKVKNTF